MCVMRWITTGTPYSTAQVAGFADTLENLDEDDKETLINNGVLNEDGDKWINAGINKEAKALSVVA